MTDTNLTQRDNADYLDNTNRLAYEAWKRFVVAMIADCPTADAKKHQWLALEARCDAGETVTPRF